MKELLKKLNNFRLTTFLFSGCSLLGILLMVASFFLYQTANVTLDAETEAEVVTHAFINTNSTLGTGAEVMGMMFFITAILLIVAAVIVIYQGFPFMFPKAKGNPTKMLGWVNLAQGALMLIMLIYMIIMLKTESIRNTPFWIMVMIFGFIDVLASAFLAFINHNALYYCPDVKKK